jgi:hypothetical protein
LPISRTAPLPKPIGLKTAREHRTREAKFYLRPSTWKAASQIGVEYDMTANEVFRCVLRAVHRRDVWRELLTPVHEILLVGDRK